MAYQVGHGNALSKTTSRQDAADTARRRAGYTGTAFDTVCMQWQVWHRGELVGWRDHHSDAAADVRRAVR
jgi:hypothetical protein